MDWLKKRVEVAELYTTNIESELNFLKTQINPHFLFNTLNSIYALALKKSDEAPDLILKLSEIMRYMLYDCNEDLVPLDQEIGRASCRDGRRERWQEWGSQGKEEGAA